MADEGAGGPDVSEVVHYQRPVYRPILQVEGSKFLLGEVAPHCYLVPFSSVAQVLDVEVVLVRPEVEGGGVGLGGTEHGLGGGSALVESVVPVFNTEPVAETRVVPVGDVSGSIDVGVGCLTELVDEDAAIYFKSGGFGDRGVG